MADNTTLNAGAGGDTIATDDIAGVKHQMVKVEFGVLDSATLVSTSNPLPIDQTNATVADGGALPAKGVQVGGTDGSVFQVFSTDNAGRLNANINGTVPVSGPLTDTQLRASAVPVDTELPAAAALADTAANPTAPAVGAFALLWNGATWDRVPGSAANGLTANLKALNGTAVDTNSGNKSGGTQRVVLATDQPQLTNAMKVDGSAVTQPVSGTVTANPAAATVGGATPNTYVSAASTNATSVKASAGTLYGIVVSNTNAAARYLKIFNKASAPTVGTDTPVLNIMIPGNTAGAGSNVIPDIGVAFGTGIAFALTTGIGLTDSAAVAANELTVNLFTK